jgi:hypothetical protein
MALTNTTSSRVGDLFEAEGRFRRMEFGKPVLDCVQVVARCTRRSKSHDSKESLSSWDVIMLSSRDPFPVYQTVIIKDWLTRAQRL